MRIPKFVSDPFLMLIAVVVLVPALFFAYGVSHQQTNDRDIKGVASAPRTEESKPPESPTSTASTKTATINQAEQVAPTVQPTAPAPVVPVPVCDEAAKAAAAVARDQQVASEHELHEKQRVKLLLISTIYRKYWDEELSRHEGALQSIEATYQAAVAAARC